MDWYRITVDLIRAVAWPLAVSALGGFFLVRYRADIAGILRRVREVPTPLGPLSISQEVSEDRDIQERVGELGTVLEEERADLAETISTKEQWEQQAVQYYTAYWYEYTYRLMFGTQLSLLQYVNQRPLGATADELAPYYEQHVALARPVSPVSREQFLGFLLNMELLTLVNNTQYMTTEWGQGFLQYLIRARIPIYRPW